MNSSARTTRDQFEKSFGLAAKVVDTARNAIDKLDYSGISERGSVARPFLTASLDHASSLMYLIGTMSSKYMLSSMALFRPQIETFSRGVFFASTDACTEKEIRAFLDTDKLPKRPRPGGGKGTMTMEQLFDVVRDEMLKVPGMATADNEIAKKDVFRYGSDEFHAPVHGGRLLVAGYIDTLEGLYMCPSFDVMLGKVRVSAACAVSAQVFMNWRVCGLPEPAPDAESAAARAAFYADIA